MFRFFFTLIFFESFIINVSSLYCYVCSNCEQKSDYSLTSQFIGSTSDLSCYKLFSRLSDDSVIVVRGYSQATCTSSQITNAWGYEQGFCCSTDYCNKTVRINSSITLLLLFFIMKFFLF